MKINKNDFTPFPKLQGIYIHVLPKTAIEDLNKFWTLLITDGYTGN